MEDGDEIVYEIMAESHSVGFLGYVFYQHQQDVTNLNDLTIEGVDLSFKMINNDSYFLSRPLFIYSAANIIQKKPQVAAFINFYLTNVNEEIVEDGYFPASSSALDKSRTTLLEVMEIYSLK